MTAPKVSNQNSSNATFKDKEKPVQVRETNITAAKGLQILIMFPCFKGISSNNEDFQR